MKKPVVDEFFRYVKYLSKRDIVGIPSDKGISKVDDQLADFFNDPDFKKVLQLPLLHIISSHTDSACQKTIWVTTSTNLKVLAFRSKRRRRIWVRNCYHTPYRRDKGNEGEPQAFRLESFFQV